MQNRIILAVIYVVLSLLSAKAFAECEGKLHYLSEYNGSKIYTADTGNANYFESAAEHLPFPVFSISNHIHVSLP